MNSINEIIAFVPEKRPVKIRIKSALVQGPWLPARSRAQNNSIPTHLEKCFAIVVPGRINHAQRSGRLTVTHEVDDVLRRVIDVGKDLVPTPHAGTHELLQPGLFERVDARGVILSR